MLPTSGSLREERGLDGREHAWEKATQALARRTGTSGNATNSDSDAPNTQKHHPHPALAMLYFFLSFFNVFKFIYFERKRVRRGGAEREREREIPSRLWAVSVEPEAGLEPTNSEIVT